ncbi:MAG: hypothetical protein WC867_02015 [Candidatus Pacearchaeota archaeon]|jgi:hypothetical protein
MSNQVVKRKISKERNIKADSLMISYVLLISMALILGIGVYGWLSHETPSDVQEVDCGEDTFLSLENYECTPGEAYGGIKLLIKNNGRFNIDGFVLTASNDTNKTPIIKLTPKSKNLIKSIGYIDFESPLTPGKEKEIEFDNIFKNDHLESLVSLKIQPFRYGENKKDRLLCKETKFSETVEDCIIGANPPGYVPSNNAPLPPSLPTTGYTLPSCVQVNVPFTIQVEYADPENTLQYNDLSRVYLALGNSFEPKLYLNNPGLILYRIAGGNAFGVVNNSNYSLVTLCDGSLTGVWNENIRLSCLPAETFSGNLVQEGSNPVKIMVTYRVTITNAASLSAPLYLYAYAADIHGLNSGWSLLEPQIAEVRPSAAAACP